MPPGKLTEETLKRIENSVAIGMYIDDACHVAGVSEQTFNKWIKLAEESLARGEDSISNIYLQAMERLKTCHALATQNLMEQIAKGVHNWQARAWILERTRNQKFGQRQEVYNRHYYHRLDAPKEAPVEYDHWIERIRDRGEITDGEIVSDEPVKDSV